MILQWMDACYWIKALQQCAWPKHPKQPKKSFSFGLAREGSQQHYNTRLGEKIPSCAELKGKSSWNANHKTKSRQKQGKGGVNHTTHLFPPICCIFSNSNCVEHLHEWKLKNTCPHSPCPWAPPPPKQPQPHTKTKTPFPRNTHKRKGKRSNKKIVFTIWQYIHNKKGGGAKRNTEYKTFLLSRSVKKKKKRLNHLTAVFS